MAKKKIKGTQYHFCRFNRSASYSNIKFFHRHSRKEKSQSEKSRWNKVQTITQIALVVITCFLVGIGVWQAYISNEATGISRESIKIQSDHIENTSRAYFSVHKIEPLKLDDFEKQYIKVTFKNCGQTPAYNSINIIKVFLSKSFCDTAKLDTNTPIISEMVVGADGVFYAQNKFLIKKSWINLVKDKNLYINVIGNLTYTDIFHKTHVLKYQFYYNVDRNTYTYCTNNDENF